MSKSTGMYTVYWDTNFEVDEEEEEDYSKYMNPPAPDDWSSNSEYLKSLSTFKIPVQPRSSSDTKERMLVRETSPDSKRKKNTSNLDNSCFETHTDIKPIVPKQEKIIEVSVADKIACIDVRKEEITVKSEDQFVIPNKNKTSVENFRVKEHTVIAKSIINAHRSPSITKSFKLENSSTNANCTATNERYIKVEKSEDIFKVDNCEKNNTVTASYHSTVNIQFVQKKSFSSKRAFADISDNLVINLSNKRSNPERSVITASGMITDESHVITTSENVGNKSLNLEDKATGDSSIQNTSSKMRQLLVFEKGSLVEIRKITSQNVDEPLKTQASKPFTVSSVVSANIQTTMTNVEATAVQDIANATSNVETTTDVQAIASAIANVEATTDVKFMATGTVNVEDIAILKVQGMNGKETSPMVQSTDTPTKNTDKISFKIKELDKKIQLQSVPTTIDIISKQIDFPCVGLDYVFEIQRPNVMHEVFFRCELCSTKCRQKTILFHLKSFKHQLRCLQRYRPLLYQYYRFQPKAKVSGIVEDYIKNLEIEMGKGTMTVKPLHIPSKPCFVPVQSNMTSGPLKKIPVTLSKMPLSKIPPPIKKIPVLQKSTTPPVKNITASVEIVTPQIFLENIPAPVDIPVTEKSVPAVVKAPVCSTEKNSSQIERAPTTLETTRDSLSKEKSPSLLHVNSPAKKRSPSLMLVSSREKDKSPSIMPLNPPAIEKSLSKTSLRNLEDIPKEKSPTRSNKTSSISRTSPHHRSSSKKSPEKPYSSLRTSVKYYHESSHKASSSQAWSVKEIRRQHEDDRRQIKSAMIEFSNITYKGDVLEPDRSMGDFYCRVCDSHMSSELIWESHIVGKRHRKNLKKPTGVKPSKVKSVKRSDIRPIILDDLESVEDPIVGLKYISELIKVDKAVGPNYACYLCSGSFSRMNIITHLISSRHRLEYIKEVEPDSYDLANNFHFSKHALERFVENKAAELENLHGRGRIEVRMEVVNEF